MVYINKEISFVPFVFMILMTCGTKVHSLFGAFAQDGLERFFFLAS